MVNRGMDSVTGGAGGGSFGYMLEKEMAFDDEYNHPSSSSSSHLLSHNMPTYHNSMSHSRDSQTAK